MAHPRTSGLINGRPSDNVRYYGTNPSDPNAPTSLPPPHPPHTPDWETWYHIENGRWYDNFKRGKYLFPADEDELDRLDIFHRFFGSARYKDPTIRRICARLLPARPRVLDVGCGSGVWAIDMAETCPTATVTGWDLSYIQPDKIPPGVSFHRRDIEDSWDDVAPSSFDFVHARMLVGAIADWPRLFQNIFRVIAPGEGCLENLEIDFMPRAEDGSQLPHESRLGLWAREMDAAMRSRGYSMGVYPDADRVLKEIGFVDVEHVVRRVPFGPWSDDEVERELGKWFNLGMTQGIEGLSLAPLTRHRGYSREKVLQLTQEVKREICSRESRAYCHLHIWIARKP